MRINTVLIGLVFVLLFVNHASAATNNSDPFSPGNAKTAYDQQSSEFKNTFVLLFGIFWIVVGSIVMISLGGATSAYSMSKSGQFSDPEKKSGGGASMLGIIVILLGLLMCLSVVKPIFGF